MTLLLLAGTGEARRLAAMLAEAGVETIASLAGATRDPAALPVPTRSGGFGGARAQAAFLREAGITAVIDATHPFAHRISARSQRLCAEAGLPYLQLLRPGWTAGPGDDWTWLADEAEAAAHVPEGAVVFLATGRQGLERFAGLAGREVICRQIDPPDTPFPFAGGRFLVGRPPFSVADERRLFAELGVDVLVVKDAGGAASRTKLDAARELGIPVLLLARPPQPPGDKAQSVEAAMDWVRALDA